MGKIIMAAILAGILSPPAFAGNSLTAKDAMEPGSYAAAVSPEGPPQPSELDKTKADLAQCRAVLRVIGQADTTRAGQLFQLAGPEAK